MPTHQFSMDLITREVNKSFIQQRANDGYINATQLCDVAAKKWHNYLREETTGHFLRALSEKSGIPVKELHQEFMLDDGAKCAWVHPKVSIHLAQWLSAEFAVQVSEWVYEWMGGQRAQTAPSHHIERYMSNYGNFPSTHFSILQEMTMTLIAPMEAQGYRLPETMVPDISQGRFFAKHARDSLGIDTDQLPTYQHKYADGRVFPAKLYPVEYLGHFRKFINEEWMPKQAQRYFGERDHTALLALDKVLQISYQPPVGGTVKIEKPQ